MSSRGVRRREKAARQRACSRATSPDEGIALSADLEPSLVVVDDTPVKVDSGIEPGGSSSPSTSTVERRSKAEDWIDVRRSSDISSASLDETDLRCTTAIDFNETQSHTTNKMKIFSASFTPNSPHKSRKSTIFSTKKKESQRLNALTRACREMHDSEEVYVDTLQAIVRALTAIYRELDKDTPRRSASVSSLDLSFGTLSRLSTSMQSLTMAGKRPDGAGLIARIVTHVRHILVVHEALLGHLSRALASWDPKSPRLAQIFFAVANELDVCGAFLRSKASIDEELVEARAESELLDERLAEFEREQCFSLSDELTKIVQRVTKYPLLLQNYEKYLSVLENVDEIKLSKAAITRVERCVHSINASMSPAPSTTVRRAVGTLYSSACLQSSRLLGRLRPHLSSISELVESTAHSIHGQWHGGDVDDEDETPRRRTVSMSVAPSPR